MELAVEGLLKAVSDVRWLGLGDWCGYGCVRWAVMAFTRSRSSLTSIGLVRSACAPACSRCFLAELGIGAEVHNRNIDGLGMGPEPRKHLVAGQARLRTAVWLGWMASQELEPAVAQRVIEVLAPPTGQVPVAPSASSRRRSRCPLCRAVSSTKWNRIQRSVTGPASRTGRLDGVCRSREATRSR